MFLSCVKKNILAARELYRLGEGREPGTKTEVGKHLDHCSNLVRKDGVRDQYVPLQRIS